MEPPRTRHLSPDGQPRYTNRLVHETSPYLRQHAHNPVDWRPWSDAAFAEARRRGVPVLLSVGYATCHWCHVMEEESFEDEEIASFLNAHYVPVKVDREERPDVDQVYMACVTAWSGHGGWPMTVWLKDDRRPFFGGTYFPARDGDRGSRHGFLTLLAELARLYREEPDRVEQAAGGIVEAVQTHLAPAAAPHETRGRAADVAPLRRAFAFYRERFDPERGGLDGAPKFPSSLPVRFLLRYGRRFDPDATAMAELTLEWMARGGLMDQIGGGFHRYSVDAAWLVPHFEKMLYDNALLAVAYLEGWQATGRAEFQAVVRQTLDYALAEMRAPEGGFYSATDADSPNPERHGEREEGWFFTWTPAELQAVLGEERARLAAAYFGVAPGGNFEGRSILHVPRPAAAVAAQLGLPEADLLDALAGVKRDLYAARSRRPPPLTDDKILTGWNALMISALARAGAALGEPRYLAAATAAAAFLTTRMTVGGELQRTYRAGVAKIPAFLEDQAAAALAFLDLFEATFAPAHLDQAIQLAEAAEGFADRDGGGYFATSERHERLLVREKPSYDGATPSGNSLLAVCQARLGELTGAARWRERAERTVAAAAGTLSRSPWALAEMLLAVDFLSDRPRQIAFVAPALADLAPFLAALGRRFEPNRVVAAATPATAAALAATVPLLDGRGAPGGRPTAYICAGAVCRLPATDPDAFIAELNATTTGSRPS